MKRVKGLRSLPSEILKKNIDSYFNYYIHFGLENMKNIQVIICNNRYTLGHTIQF